MIRLTLCYRVVQIPSVESNLIIIFLFQRMEESLMVEPIQSIVPVNAIQPFCDSVSKKYWHIICKAQYLIPLGLCSLKVSIFLISFNSKLFLTITFEVLQMLPPPQEDLEFPIDPPLSNNSSQESIPLPSGPIPVGYGVFELPECPRCFLGYSCNMHHSCH